MNNYCNPESYNDHFQDYNNTSKQYYNSPHKYKQISVEKKKPTIIIQSTPKSVGKFRRTNPSLHNIKAGSPHPQRRADDQSVRNTPKYETYSSTLLSEQNIQKISFVTPLSTSRQTTRTGDVKTLLYLSPSKQHKILLTDRNSMTRQKYNFQNQYQNQNQNQDLKSLKSFKSGKSSNKGSRAQNQNYSLYWKKKAHQYLENNFKLSQEIGELKKQLSKYEILLPVQGSVTSSEMVNSQTQSEHKAQRAVPIHIVEIQQRRYIREISQLEISNKLKDSVIQNLQNKIIQLTLQIKGENHKNQLMERMRKQIQELQDKNKTLNKQHQYAIKLNKVYQTQKALQQVKQKPKSSIKIAQPQFGQYRFEKDLEKTRYRNIE